MKSYRKEITAKIRGELRKRNEAAGVTITNNVRARTPVDTGRLRASISWEADEAGVVVGTNVDYAKYQELGWRYGDPQPFLVPGLLGSIGNLRRIYGGG